MSFIGSDSMLIGNDGGVYIDTDATLELNRRVAQCKALQVIVQLRLENLSQFNAKYSIKEPVTAKDIVNFFIVIWGLRLAIHIYIKNKGQEEDWRYINFRKNWIEKWQRKLSDWFFWNDRKVCCRVYSIIHPPLKRQHIAGLSQP